VTLLGIPVLVMLGTCGLGTWRWFTLSYALAPTALEIHCGTSRHRIRYEDVEGVSRGERSAPGAPGALWPGAPGGAQPLDAERVGYWWGTTHQRANRVVIRCGAGSVVLTPEEPEAFCEALWINVRRSAPGSTSAGSPAHRWLDRVAGLDGWFRFLTLLALGVAAAGVLVDVLATGMMSRPSTVAAIALLVNGGIGLLALAHARSVARVMIGATLALQCLGLLL
jgi:hypothetical protein